jgi:PBSX family phage terminase large subunit
MTDNPSLTQKIRRRYENLYSGVFYQRFVLGQWVQAEGRVYDFFSDEMVRPVPQEPMEQYCISCDYGTVNPTSMGLWGRKNGTWYRIKEFYFDSRREKRQMTDEEYAAALEKLAGDRKLAAVIVDPSAASFLEVLRRRGHRVKKASNDVLTGIRMTADALKSGKVVICEGCEDCLREMELYVWEARGIGADRVRKEHDHAMDDMRYFVATMLNPTQGGFAVCSVERKGR